MSNRFARYSITGGLTTEEIHRMYDEALEVLEKVGVECHHKKVLSRLADFKGLKVEPGRVRFKKEFVDGLVKDCRKKAKAANEKKTKPENFSLGGPYTCFYVLDYSSDKPRKATLADLRNALKLCDSMGLGRTCAPIIPDDVPIPLQRVAMFKASAENSRSLGGLAKGVISIEEAELVCEMGEASGRKPPYFHLQFFISPLKYDDAMLDIGYHFVEKGKKHLAAVWGGPMCCAGATAPLFVPGAFVQGLAESIASETLTSLVFGGEFLPSLSAWVFDMQYGTFIFGSPENLLFSMASNQIVAELFGAGGGGCGLGTNSSSVDEHAASERAFNVIIGALNGATGFGGAGMISQDMIFSPEQLVIDREIVDWAQRFMAGLEISDAKGASLDAIKEVGPGGNFLSHPTTVENLQKFYWRPKLFERISLGQWLQQGSVSLREKARQIAEEKIKSHKFEIDGSVRKKLTDIYKKAEGRLLKK
jgi:trimethylamine--corrinoid protein Co-methyltransferase